MALMTMAFDGPGPKMIWKLRSCLTISRSVWEMDLSTLSFKKARASASDISFGRLVIFVLLNLISSDVDVAGLFTCLGK